MERDWPRAHPTRLSASSTSSREKPRGIPLFSKGKFNLSPHLIVRHTAPVWQLAWAHPSFGSILASCSYDGRVFIWKETGGKGGGGELQDGWERIKEHTLHTASGECQRNLELSIVNSISWAPYELGPIIACASSDGKISVLSFQSEHDLV